MSSDLKVTNIKHASSGSNNLVLGSDGSATINQISSSTVFPAGGTGNPISFAVIADVKSSSTSGGDSTSGSWETRDLNTEISDADGIVSIASNQFTLGAGTYVINFSAPAFQSGSHQARLYDITGSAVLALGSTEYQSNSDATQTVSIGSFIHSPTSSNTYKIQHRVADSKVTYGHGVNSGFADNHYTRVIIYKLK
jgi:hypothetical protein